MPSFYLLSCADDRAVSNNNGRPGASDGPEAFEQFFKKINSKFDINSKVSNLEKAEIKNSISETHKNVSDGIESGHKKYDCSIFIGGGHDYAYPHLSGIKKSINGEIGCINIDPHFDLRKPNPEILSGSPFYLAIENNVINGNNLIEFGIGEHCNGKELWEYAENKNVVVQTFPEMRYSNKVLLFENSLKSLAQRSDKIVLSIDLDAIQAAFAPGVSAPATEGFTPSEVLQMTAIAACEKKVISLGIYELNPKFDIDNRTARLATLLAFEFIKHKNYIPS